MLFVLNVSVQLWALVAAVIVAVRNGWPNAIGMLVSIFGLHWFLVTLADYGTRWHMNRWMRSLSPEEKAVLEFKATIRRFDIPKAWNVINGTCGVLFFVLANWIILSVLFGIRK